MSLPKCVCGGEAKAWWPDEVVCLICHRKVNAPTLDEAKEMWRRCMTKEEAK